jgi:lysophospholipase L1-like esterase
MTPSSTARQGTVAAKILRWFMVVWFCLTLPVVGLLAVNHYLQFAFLEIASHYVSKVTGMKYVFIGDSLTTGASSWSLRVSNNPFSSRNLAHEAYTVHQVRMLVKQALAYHPLRVFILAGTNDILDEGYDRERVLADYKSMLASVKEGNANPVVTLVPHTGNGRCAEEIDSFNNGLRKICAELAVPIVDLNPVMAPDRKLLPQFTVDGVHLTKQAYKIWAAQLRQVIGG